MRIAGNAIGIIGEPRLFSPQSSAIIFPSLSLLDDSNRANISNEIMIVYNITTNSYAQLSYRIPFPLNEDGHMIICDDGNTDQSPTKAYFFDN